MTTNTPERTLFRPTAIVAASGTKFAGAIVLAQPLPMRVAACTAASIVVLLALLLACGHYTRKARVEGELVPAAGSIKVVNPSFGRITRALVTDGVQVAAGQPLFELTAERASGGADVDARITALLAERSRERSATGRLQAEELREHAQALAARQRSLTAELANRRQALALQDAQIEAVRKKLARFKRLSGFISPAQLDDVASALAAQQAQRKDMESNLLAVERDLMAMREEAQAIDRKLRQAASTASQELAALAQETAEHDSRSRSTITTPIAGTVTALALEEGQTAAPGSVLATVIPAGSALQARLLVPSRAIAFIEVGQQVLLRIDAFPYQKFGPVPATVTRVEQAPSNADGSSNASPLYRVVARLDRSTLRAYGRDRPFKAGMTLEADILQDRRRLIEWLFEPLISAAKGRAR